MGYTLKENETCRSFIYRALQGKTDDERNNLFIFLLEMIVSEIKETTFSVSLNVIDNEITFHIVHHGKAIKKNVLCIIDDQVDHLFYQHQSKDTHTLKIRIKLN